jgi:hypothetical protein
LARRRIGGPSFRHALSVAFAGGFRQSLRMKGFLRVLCLATLALPANARDYKLYAALLENTPVELSDGAKWMMDKGDVFPVLMYKESQTRIVLQLAGATFMTEARRVRVLPDSEIPAGLVNYRKNVEIYLKTKTEKWRAAHDPKKTESETPKP